MTPGKRENVFTRWNNLIRENINPYTHIFVFYIIISYYYNKGNIIITTCGYTEQIFY